MSVCKEKHKSEGKLKFKLSPELPFHIKPSNGVLINVLACKGISGEEIPRNKIDAFS